MSEFEFIEDRRIQYGEEGATFIPRCERCKRYVRAPESVKFNGLGYLVEESNIDCSKCGKTKMIFEGYFCWDEE